MSDIITRHREWVKWKLRQYGPGREASVRKLAIRIREELTKWKHSDPRYGEKLARAMVRIAALKREGN